MTFFEWISIAMGLAALAMTAVQTTMMWKQSERSYQPTISVELPKSVSNEEYAALVIKMLRDNYSRFHVNFFGIVTIGLLITAGMMVLFVTQLSKSTPAAIVTFGAFLLSAALTVFVLVMRLKMIKRRFINDVVQILKDGRFNVHSASKIIRDALKQFGGDPLPLIQAIVLMFEELERRETLGRAPGLPDGHTLERVGHRGNKDGHYRGTDNIVAASTQSNCRRGVSRNRRRSESSL
jgi:hypothetical protein